MIDQAQCLTQTVSAGMQPHLGMLGVRVNVPSGATEVEISDAVTEVIMRALRK
jgi:hypothetical protein